MSDEPGTYITTLKVDEIFADPTYQRIPDLPRARKMGRIWDRRLAGIIEVSDRGETSTPRYAVIDGQHRWAAARSLVNPPALVANVHEGLTVQQEAQLFDTLNRQRKQTNIFDHYKARLAAGDWEVESIQRVLDRHGLRVDPAPAEGCVGCVGTLEKVADIDDALLDETLQLIISIWQKRRDALDAPIIHGLALILHHLRDEIDLERLIDALLDVMPRQLKTQAVSLRDMQSGTLPVLTATVIMSLYNKKPGRKIQLAHGTFRPGKQQTPPEKSFVREYRHLHESGVSDFEIAQRMGIKLASLVRNLERHQLAVSPELASLAHDERTCRSTV